MSLSALTVALTLTAADGGWCWDELGRLSEADNEWSLAVGPREDFWAATSDKVWRWHDGGFAPIALPLADMRWVRVVSAADRVFVSGKNNLPNGASVFSVHEWVDGGFQQLGQPLGAPLIRYAHTNDDRVVSADGGLVATWTEEVDLRPLGLFTARWDGAQWARARVANLREYDVNPDVTALPDGGLVTWNEHASEGAAVFVRVRRCRSGELARPTPPGARERDGWPQRVDDAARWVIRETPSEVRSRFRATKQGDLVTWHHGLGTWVRNRSGLWRGNDALLRDCSRGQTPLVHPDDCSMMILKSAWLLLQGDAGLP